MLQEVELLVAGGGPEVIAAVGEAGRTIRQSIFFYCGSLPVSELPEKHLSWLSSPLMLSLRTPRHLASSLIRHPPSVMS